MDEDLNFTSTIQSDIHMTYNLAYSGCLDSPVLIFEASPLHAQTNDAASLCPHAPKIVDWRALGAAPPTIRSGPSTSYYTFAEYLDQSYSQSGLH